MITFLFNLPVIAYILTAVGASFLFLLYTVSQILKESDGTGIMREIAESIQKGAAAFLKREFKALSFVLAVIALLLLLINKAEALSFLFGALVSAVTGIIGMRVATKANVRTAEALKQSFSRGFKIAFSGGAVMGMAVVSFGLLGAGLIYSITQNTGTLIGYAFGSSLVALFLRVGGGIYTKSADVGADLVGKVEAGIPEDDYRNPATIADNVGDNVGDIAGMGSDLFESYVSAIVAAMILGIATIGEKGAILPLLLASAGIIFSLVGIFFVRISKEAGELPFEEQTKKIRSAMNRGVVISNLLMIAAAFFIVQKLFGEPSLFYTLVVGMAVGFIIGKATEYYTASEKPPTQSIVEASETGPSTNIIQGLSVGMMSTLVPVFATAVGTVLVYELSGIYGIALASVGILVVLGINLSMDSYGPIADNAAGIAEMSGLGEDIRKKADALDSVGNTTAAIGKGFAIGSAAFAALAWVATFFHEAGLENVDLINPRVIAGIFIGAMISFVFSALLMRAVGKGGAEVVKEVRRQFKEIPGLLEGKAKADHSLVVDITTKRALKDMIIPGILVVLTPLAVGFAGGLDAIGGLLVGALSSGFVAALFMSNSGGAWDNAKKYIEAGHKGGKGSATHKAAVVGDTVGDPFKDTAGPSLNILIKLMGKVAVISIPLLLLF